MTDVHECENESCSNTFDVDLNQGVVKTVFNNGTVETHHYCCKEHRY